MSISNAEEKNLLKSLKGTAPTTYEKLYVKLHTGAPGEECTENAATETTRKEVKFTGENPLKNEAEIKWENVSTGETYKQVSLWSAATEGTAVWYGALEAEKTVSAGDNFAIKAEKLEVSLD